MSDEPYATRREFDLLAQRVETMDRDGTRGVVVLHERIADLTRDVVKLETALTAHEESHRRDAEDRAKGRRWLVTTGIALVVMLCAVIALLLQMRAAAAR
jgi:hypothetical protein